MKTKYFDKVISFLLVLIMAVGFRPAITQPANAAVINVDMETRNKYRYGVTAIQALSSVAGKKWVGELAGGVFAGLFPSDTDYILEAIAELSTKMDKLSAQISDMETNFMAKGNEIPIKVALIDHLNLYTSKMFQLKIANEDIIRNVEIIEELENFYSGEVLKQKQEKENRDLLLITVPRIPLSGTTFHRAVRELGEIIIGDNIGAGSDLLDTFDRFAAYAYKWEHLGYNARIMFRAYVSNLYANLAGISFLSLSARIDDAEANGGMSGGETLSSLQAQLSNLEKLNVKVYKAFMDHEVNILPESYRYYNYPGHELLLSSDAVARTMYWNQCTSYNKAYNDLRDGLLQYKFMNVSWEKAHTYPTAEWFRAVYNDYAGTNRDLYNIFFDSKVAAISRTAYDNFKSPNSSGTQVSTSVARPKFATESGPYPQKSTNYIVTRKDEYFMNVVDGQGLLSDYEGKTNITWLADYMVPISGSPHIPEWRNLSAMAGLIVMERLTIGTEGWAQAGGPDRKFLFVEDKSRILPGPYSYEWQERKPNEGWVTLSNPRVADPWVLDLGRPDMSVMADYEYRCIISKLNGSSQVIETEVETTLPYRLGGLQWNPGNSYPTEGMAESYDYPYSSSITLSVPTELTNQGLSYQWQVSTDNGATFNSLFGETGETYALGTVGYPMNGNIYMCYVYDANGGDPITVTYTDRATLNLNLNLNPVGNWKDNTTAGFDGGNGTLATPYEIASAEQLAYLAAQVNDGTSYSGSYFTLTDNIELGEHFWTPIGTQYQFMGTFDGGGHYIGGMKIDTAYDNAGLFGNIYEATIKDLTVSGNECTITMAGSGMAVGGLAGRSERSTITNCHTGVNIITMRSNAVGGLIGDSSSDKISDCYAVSYIDNDDGMNSKLGGLVGNCNWVEIENCFTLGTIVGTYDDIYPCEIAAGGLVGRLAGECSIENSYAAAELLITNNGGSGDVKVGGLIGSSVGNDFGDITVTDCYAGIYTEGNSLNGIAFVGGLVGYSHNTNYERCYAKDAVIGSGVIAYTVNGLFGAIGANDSNDIFWDMTTTGCDFGGINLLGNGSYNEDDVCYLPYSNLLMQDMTDDDVLMQYMTADDELISGAMNALGTVVWTKKSNDGSARYYPQLRTFEESTDFFTQIISELSTSVFNPWIEFDPNGGVLDTFAHVQTNPDYTLDSLPVPTRDGYTFDGWYDANFMSKVTTGTMFFGDDTVYAKWTQNTVYIPPAPEPEPKTEKTAEIENSASLGEPLTVQVGNVQYILLPEAMDTAAILELLGTDDAGVVSISISITVPENAADFEAAISETGCELILPLIEFIVTATYDGVTIEITMFAQYVSRVVEVTEEQAGIITTAVVVNPDGSLRHVPTRVYELDGRWYTEVNSLTNSVYAFVNNEVAFTDTAGKWYENDVGEMANRLILNGVGGGLFAGERDITRAEFAAILVRALGLPSDGDCSVFTDVSGWYSGAVGTAYRFGLINGVGNNLFAPDRKITREEAMVMIRRAAKLAGFEGTTAELTAFDDAGSVSEWAQDAAQWNVGSGLIVGSDGKLAPQDNIIRAEVAILVLRLLRYSNLI